MNSRAKESCHTFLHESCGLGQKQEVNLSYDKHLWICGLFISVRTPINIANPNTTEQNTVKIISKLVQKSSENNTELSKHIYQPVPCAYIFTTETQPIESRHLNYSKNNEMQSPFKPILTWKTDKTAQ